MFHVIIHFRHLKIQCIPYGMNLSNCQILGNLRQVRLQRSRGYLLAPGRRMIDQFPRRNQSRTFIQMESQDHSGNRLLKDLCHIVENFIICIL